MEQKEIEETLMEIGLSIEEIKVYLTMLNLGSNLASKISEETKINRSHVYQLLERLISKGFVSYVIKENRKYFSAVNPEKLIQLIKEKEQKLKDILPSLLEIKTSDKEKPVVEILEGKQGIKTILNDILKLKKEWLGFGSTGKGTEVFPYYAEHYEKERVKLKIPFRAIFDNSKSGLKRGDELSKLKFTQVRYALQEYSAPSSTWIYGNRLAFVLWDKEHPFAIRIISKEVTDNFKSHFEVLWKIAKG